MTKCPLNYWLWDCRLYISSLVRGATCFVSSLKCRWNEKGLALSFTSLVIFLYQIPATQNKTCICRLEPTNLNQWYLDIHPSINLPLVEEQSWDSLQHAQFSTFKSNSSQCYVLHVYSVSLRNSSWYRCYILLKCCFIWTLRLALFDLKIQCCKAIKKLPVLTRGKTGWIHIFAMHFIIKTHPVPACIIEPTELFAQHSVLFIDSSTADTGVQYHATKYRQASPSMEIQISFQKHCCLQHCHNTNSSAKLQLLPLWPNMDYWQ